MYGKLALVGAKQPTVQSHTQKKKRKSKRLVEQEYDYRLFHVYWYHGAITGLGFVLVLGVFYSGI